MRYLARTNLTHAGRTTAVGDEVHASDEVLAGLLKRDLVYAADTEKPAARVETPHKSRAEAPSRKSAPKRKAK